MKYSGSGPVTWLAQLQTIHYALRETIPIIKLLKEMKRQGIPGTRAQAKVQWQVFEGNSGTLEMAKVHKFRLRTKHKTPAREAAPFSVVCGKR